MNNEIIREELRNIQKKISVYRVEIFQRKMLSNIWLYNFFVIRQMI